MSISTMVGTLLVDLRGDLVVFSEENILGVKGNTGKARGVRGWGRGVSPKAVAGALAIVLVFALFPANHSMATTLFDCAVDTVPLLAGGDPPPPALPSEVVLRVYTHPIG